MSNIGKSTSGRFLQAVGTSGNANYTTTTYPSSTTINQLLYSSAANTIAELATANSGVLVTSSGGVPSINATVSSWAPVLDFGGASTGITYATQSGGYYVLGQILFFDMTLTLTNKGSSTGTASITGLPANVTPRTSTVVISAGTLTYTGQVTASIASGAMTITLLSWASGGSSTLLTDTAFANNTFIVLSGQVLLS